MVSRRNQRGSAVIEFALSFTALWFLFMGAFQFGYSFWLYNAANTQIADAARFAMRTTYKESSADTFKNAVKNMAVYGNPDGTGTRVVPNLQTSHVDVALTPSAGVPTSVTVRLTGYTINAVFKTFTFNNRPSVTMNYAGTYQE